MVYGRVHESEYNHSTLLYLENCPNLTMCRMVDNKSFVCTGLSTVIGVKCMAPGSDGKPTMKAKSFVSDKYKELFEIASEY